jgi:crotonobetainyl-CoA:carnitine CoA-transferase CaiB-like acyl-CoA transferase
MLAQSSPTTTPVDALSGLTVLQLSSRVGCALSATLLAQSGADVLVLESRNGISSGIHRLHAMAGKRSVVVRADGTDTDWLTDFARSADVILYSSDGAPSCLDIERLDAHGVVAVDVCSVADALGAMPADAIRTDAAMQALSGMMMVTGMADGPPCLQDGQPLEVITALHAYAAALAGLYARARDGYGQHARVALLDCSVSSHAVFVSRCIEDPSAPAMRSGNRHQLASPWNIFAATDGWLLICMATEAQWQRVCELMGEPELAFQQGYASGTQRQGNIDAVEARVQAWVGTMTSAQVALALLAVGIPCGSVAAIDRYPREANLCHRKMVIEVLAGADAAPVYIANAPLRASLSPGRGSTHVPPADADRSWAQQRARDARAQSSSAASDEQDSRPPLRGLRVLEIGQFTTAPVAGRYLAQLGAEVIKIEAEAGESMRAWAPQRHGVGAFFVANNIGKRHITLDLKTTAGMQHLQRLVGTADIVLENLKPGALRRLGLGFERMQELNPRIIYCAVSGFGEDSIYPGRPAYDTVIQAMSGVMDCTRSNDVPVKTGMSVADIMGANFSVGAILAALRYRDLHGLGQFIDVSMQDIAAWSTQLVWNNAEAIYARTHVLACADGHVLVTERSVPPGLVQRCSDASRDELAALWPHCVVPVRSVNELLTSELGQGQSIEVADSDGRDWPVIVNPIQLKRTPLIHPPVLATLGGDNSRLLQE